MKKSIRKYMLDRNEALNASDFSSLDWAYVLNEDGSSNLIRSAIIEKYEDYYIVFAEHGSPDIYHKDESLVFKFRQKEI